MDVSGLLGVCTICVKLFANIFYDQQLQNGNPVAVTFVFCLIYKLIRFK